MLRLSAGGLRKLSNLQTRTSYSTGVLPNSPVRERGSASLSPTRA